ncbi:MAG: APC family permease, partial [Terriglobia bacterium]
LVVVDVLMYSAGLLLEFLALIVLRANEPQLKRPFRVPGGRLGLLLVTVCPMSFASVVVFSAVTGGSSALWQLSLAALFVLAGMPVYLSRRRIRRGEILVHAKDL